MEDQPQNEELNEEPQGEWNLEEELEREPGDFEEMDEEEFEEARKPAVVINVSSWAIPIVGLVMLLVGIAAGYGGKALIAYFSGDTAAEPQVTEVTSTESVNIPAGEVAQIPTITPQQPSAEDLEQLMTFLVSQTRHFKGEEDAQVTIIEFSDFQ